jgi:leucyl aminopeptidase (aminopeptidase T)
MSPKRFKKKLTKLRDEVTKLEAIADANHKASRTVDWAKLRDELHNVADHLEDFNHIHLSTKKEPPAQNGHEAPKALVTDHAL